MPYGIQQPAISGQISLLEHELGVRLFQRRPFKLTPAGRELHAFLAPFFSGLPDVMSRIAGDAAKRLRLSAPATLLREHLPAVLAAVRKRQPDLELSLVDGDPAKSLELLENEEIDLAVTALEGRPPAGVRSEVLITMPLVLLLPPGARVPREGISALAGTQPLIRPPADTTVSRLFAKGLAKAGLSWPASIEVDSLEVIHAYVARGFGIGLSVKSPGMKVAKGVRTIGLETFPKLDIAGLWRGRLGPLASLVMEGLRERAKGRATDA